jgi:hypothetical protein
MNYFSDWTNPFTISVPDEFLRHSKKHLSFNYC